MPVVRYSINRIVQIKSFVHPLEKYGFLAGDRFGAPVDAGQFGLIEDGPQSADETEHLSDVGSIRLNGRIADVVDLAIVVDVGVISVGPSLARERADQRLIQDQFGGGGKIKAVSWHGVTDRSFRRVVPRQV